MSTTPPDASDPREAKNGPKVVQPSVTGTSSEDEKAWTVGQLLRWTQARFASEGLENARVDAEYLLAYALSCSRMSLYVDHERRVDAHERGRFREFVRRRLAREPVAYIEGKRGFHALGLELNVDPRVLIPRPETEHLVDWVVEDLRQRDGGRVLDVGTGSGAIALAIKHGCPQFGVWATDRSPDALQVAQGNAERLGLDVGFAHGNLLDAVAEQGPWDVIAANLPYIPAGDIAGLMPDVGMHEPRLALDGGEDGLEVIRTLVAQVGQRRALTPGGAIYLEVGIGQAQEVVQMLLSQHLKAEIRNDYAGIGRIVRGR